MAKTTNNYQTTIAIDTVRSTFHFYSMADNDPATISHTVKSYTGKLFDEDFFSKFKDAVKEFVDESPSEGMRKVTMILPDSAVLTDTIKMPTIKGFGQMKKAFEASLSALYRNYRDLRISSYAADQNKQYSTFVISAVQNNIVSQTYGALVEHKLLVDTLTYSSGATVAGATLMNPKLRSATFLLLDVKDVYSRFTFVVGGRAVGFYTVPFGLEFLKKPSVIGEDMLFDHSYAELTVLNAKEKAKAKKLTLKAAADEADEATFDFEVGAEEEAVEVAISPSGKTFRKTPRRLPKFMLRDIPETPEGIAYENFRVFVKWALTLIDSNKKLTELGAPEFVSVNIPEELSFLIDKANEEMGGSEGAISFSLLPTAEAAPIVAANLELYGGLFSKQINPAVKL